MNKQIVLIGMPGAGKTTIGRLISNKLNASYVDLDEYIRLKKKFNISKISCDEYLIEFRNIESKSLPEVNDYDVISLGGGTILANGIRKFLDKKITIYLEVPVDILQERIGNDRPLLQDNSLEQLYNDRKKLYEELANYKIVNNDLNETMKEIIKIVNSEG